MILLILVGIVVIIALFGFYVYKESTGFIVKKYSLFSDKISKNLVKFAFVSDLHCYEYGDNNKELLDKIVEYNPDFVIFAGDMITSKPIKQSELNKWKKVYSFIETLSSKYPVYYGIGNHEARVFHHIEEYGDVGQEYFEGLERIGVPVLRNAKKIENDFNIEIFALDLEHAYYRKVITRHIPDDYLNNIFGNVDGNMYSILIAHNPEHFKNYSKWNPDLVLSGHVHGGIVRLPLVGGVVSPALKLFPKYSGGLYKENNSTMILSKGTGTHSIPIRINNKAELIFVEINNQNIKE